MLYVAIVLLGMALTVIALLRGNAYVAGITAFATTTFAFVWPAYHFFTWATPWLIVTVCALVWAIRSRSTWSRAALIVSAGILTVLTLGASEWMLLFTAIAVVFAFIEGERGTRLWKSLGATAVAVATLAMVWFGHPVAPNIFGTAVAADATTQDLTIKPGELLPDAAKCGTDDKFNQNSMPDTKGRLWDNSVSTPFKSTDKDAQFKELVSEICVNPVLGDAYAQALGDAKISDFSVMEANPWLSDFLQKSHTKDGLEVWLTHKVNDSKTIYVTKPYRDDAQMINALLIVLDNQGTKTATSTVNWPLGSLVADTLPRAHKETKPNKQESLPFMALTFTEKGGTCPYVLGVNLKDKRPENFDCKKAKEIAPPTPTKRKPPVITPSHPTSTPTRPGHTPTHPSTPTPTPTHSTPGTCVWKNGTVHHLDHGLCPKDPGVIPTNPNHTPAGSHTESAKPPVHPSQTATPSKAGGGSTQTAGGATTAPKPTKSVPAPEVSNEPTKPAQGCTNPITGEAC